MSGIDTDEAFIALLIAAMDASGHVSAQEAARAHHVIWSMRRFRHRSGETVGRKIERMPSTDRATRSLERHRSVPQADFRPDCEPRRLRSRRIWCWSMADSSDPRGNSYDSSQTIYDSVPKRQPAF
jgi:hypothetical protein